MIKFKCPSCSSSITVADQHAGKHGTCPKCKTKVTVPAAQPMSALKQLASELVDEPLVEPEANEPTIATDEPHEPDTTNPPAYTGIHVLAQLQEKLAILLFVIAGLVFLIGVFYPSVNKNPLQLVIGTVSIALVGFAMLVSGQLITAFRDIARNSWAWRDAAQSLKRHEP